MMSNFRLLAGLTSLRSNLCLSHFCASGPEGVLESSGIKREKTSEIQDPRSREDPRDKTSKIQHPSSREDPRSNHQEPSRSKMRSSNWMLELGASLELGCWILDVHLSSLPYPHKIATG